MKQYSGIPYTYSLKHRVTGMYYYGSSYRSGCHPDKLKIEYKTSSKIIHEIIKNEGIDIFEWKVRRIFKTVEDARSHEVAILTRFKAHKNPMWYNRSNGNKGFLNGFKDKKHNIKTRNKMSENQKGENNSFYGHKHTDEFKLENSARFKGKILSMDIRFKISNNKKGVIGNAIGKRWLKNINLNEQVYVKESNIDQYIKQGYIFGKLPCKKNSGKIWMHNKDFYNVHITSDKIDFYSKFGFVLGRRYKPYKRNFKDKRKRAILNCAFYHY